jgi:hypothetical protein
MEKRLLKVWADAHICAACKLKGVTTTLATHGTTDMREVEPGVFEETKKTRYGCKDHKVVPMRFLLNGTQTPWEEAPCQ